MTLTGAALQWAISAAAAPTRTNSTSSVTIGETLGRRAFTDATIIYSFKVAAAAAGNVATLTLSTGGVAQTTGSPVITDGGVDFEGKTLAAMTTLYGLYIELTTGDTVTIAGTANYGGQLTDVGDRVLYSRIDVGATGTVTFTFTSGTGVIEVVVIGK